MVRRAKRPRHANDHARDWGRETGEASRCFDALRSRARALPILNLKIKRTARSLWRIWKLIEMGFWKLVSLKDFQSSFFVVCNVQFNAWEVYLFDKKLWFCRLQVIYQESGVRNLFNVKDAVPEGLRTRVVYKFSCASCNGCYVGETSRHFSTRVREHLLSDSSSNVFKHLQSSEFCRASCTPDCFEILALQPLSTKWSLRNPCL